jgi:hypothetical protein
MNASYKCIYCEAPLELDDINVSTDVALCRSCNKTMAFSALTEVDELAAVDIMNPPKYVTFNSEFDGGSAITYRKRSGFVFFLLPFALVLTFIPLFSIILPQLKKGQFDLGQSLGVIPFLFGAIGMWFAIFVMLFGRWVVRLSNGQGTAFIGVAGIGWTRRFNYDRTSRVSLRENGVKVNDIPKKAITIDTDGARTQFGSLMHEESKLYIAALLRQAFLRS